MNEAFYGNDELDYNFFMGIMCFFYLKFYDFRLFLDQNMTNFNKFDLVVLFDQKWGLIFL